MRFRSKPVEIHAEQLTEWYRPAGVWSFKGLNGADFVTTIQGQNVQVNHGEWIVEEPDGVHYYPVADEVFRKRWQPVDEQTAS